MTYLKINDVVAYEMDGPEWVILGIEGDDLFAINRRDINSWPVALESAILEREIEAGASKLLEASIPRARARLTDKQKAAMGRRWNLIAPIIGAGSAAFDQKARFRLMQDAAERGACALNTVRNALQDYWRKGCTPAALLTDYDRCGAPGRPRLEPGILKRGRPRTVMLGTGVNVDRNLRRVMDLAARRFLAKNRKLRVTDAYNMMLGEQFCVVTPGARPGQESAAWREGVNQYEVPTLRQFRYHLKTFGDEFELRKTRMGAKKYERNKRALPSTARSETWGPGSRYLIDATILNIYLRSRLDRSRIVGRPVLYLVIDVFSTMIVGIYVGIENPSWIGAAMALANAAQSKVEFCRQFGVEIDEGDWPCRAMPARLEADKGEVHHAVADCLTQWFGLTVESASSYRPDLKGMVEGQFEILPAHFGPYTPGYIEPDFAERGARDYRLDGVLDVAELTAILINIVLYRNNAAILDRYDRPVGMPASEVPAIPRELWNWGVANRSGALIERPDWYTRFHLMPTATASVTERGLEFEGCVYISNGMLERRWLERARHEGRWKEAISFDPRVADAVMLHGPFGDRGYEVCTLADASRAYVGSSFREIAAETRLERIQVAQSRADARVSRVELTSRIESVVDFAIAKLPAERGSNKEQVSGIRDTRSQERLHDGREEALASGLLALEHRRAAEQEEPLSPSPLKIVREPSVLRFLKDESHD